MAKTKIITKHGVFLDVLGAGVLLTGASGIGKSELALGLVNRGHRLIADDAVELHRTSGHSLMGTCPELLQDFLEVRGLGILNIRVMFGDTAIKTSKKLQLIIHIVAFDHEELKNMDRLHGMYRQRSILNVNVPEVTIPVAPGRNLSVLVESAVRNQVLMNTGYHASQEFIKRQKILMETVES
jgi:HPr kinase/phosphorylase